MESLLKKHEMKREIIKQLEREIQKELKKPTGKYKITTKKHPMTGGLITTQVKKVGLDVQDKYDLHEAKNPGGGQVYLQTLKRLQDPENIKKAAYSRETTKMVKNLLKEKYKGLDYKTEVLKFTTLKNKLKHQKVKGELLYTPKTLRNKLLEIYS